jgi:hypothetical protein
MMDRGGIPACAASGIAVKTETATTAVARANRTDNIEELQRERREDALRAEIDERASTTMQRQLPDATSPKLA